jgi:hypothetical protein
MPFDSLTPKMKTAAEKAVGFCKGQYGAGGLKIEQEIHSDISWKPTFYLKQNKFKTVAVEVEDNLYPEALKGAAHDIRHFAGLISVYQVCTLESYQNDKDQKKISLLKKHGFGVMTVADNGDVTIQHHAVPLAQHITQDEFDEKAKKLPAAIRVAFKAAYATYGTDPRQGLQGASQIIEALIYSLANQGVKAGVVNAATPKKDAAIIVDDLYALEAWKAHRAVLGGARAYLRKFRNPSSHPPRNAAEAVAAVRDYRAGVLSAMEEASALVGMLNTLGYRARIVLS